MNEKVPTAFYDNNSYIDLDDVLKTKISYIGSYIFGNYVDIINNLHQKIREPCVVAIGGATCSGKTTLAKTLKTKLGGVLVQSDIYFEFRIPHDSYKPPSGFNSKFNFETPLAINWVRFK